jgi:hypothetical protein
VARVGGHAGNLPRRREVMIKYDRDIDERLTIWHDRLTEWHRSLEDYQRRLIVLFRVQAAALVVLVIVLIVVLAS